MRATRTEAMLAGVEPLVETGYIDDADVVVVAFGTPAKFVRAAVRAAARPRAHRIGYVRPDHARGRSRPTPSPRAAAGARAVGVYENNQGQMIDDVRLAVAGAAPVEFIGGLASTARASASRPTSTSAILRDRIEERARRDDDRS